MTEKLRPTTGLRHVALFAPNLKECEKFYVELLGMKVVWRPDSDNVYLSSGHDNLALHRINVDKFSETSQRLDHIGFIIHDIDDIDKWFDLFKKKIVSIKANPRTHRDGARSFYCFDPAGTVVQILYDPIICKNLS